MSTVDVVIPCYNYARYLRGCVNSVLSQLGVDVRVLVIDDTSSDETASVGQELAAADHRVTFRRHTSNKGHIATYNEGLIGWSTANYTVLLSADDFLAPGSLSRAVSIMDANQNVGMVYGATVHFASETDIPKIGQQNWRFKQWSGPEWLQIRCSAGYNVITSPEVVVRGSIQRLVGGYRPELPHSGDLEMWLRIAAVSDVAYVLDVPQAFYRVHPKSMMRTTNKGSLLDLRQRKAAFQWFIEKNRDILQDADQLQDLSYRALAREALWDACRAYDRDELEASSSGELIDFALSTYMHASSLQEYAALRRRQRLGAAVCSKTQIFAASALVRNLHRNALKRRWQRQGV